MSVHQRVVAGIPFSSASRSDLTRLFAPAELATIRLANLDHPKTLRPAGWMARLARKLFYPPINPVLANAKLEALRRLAVTLRRSPPGFALEEATRTRAAGYSPTQIASLIAHFQVAGPNDARSKADAGTKPACNIINIILHA